MVQRLRAKDYHTEHDEAFAAGIRPHLAGKIEEAYENSTALLAFDMCSYCGDATTSDMIEREKMHLATIETLSLTADIFVGSTDPIPDRQFTCCDVHPVRKGTTAELRGIMSKQFASAGRPDWLDRVNKPVPNLVSCFTFGLDFGPDSEGLGPSIGEELKSTPN